MTKNLRTLSAIKSKLTRIAQDIETPDEVAAQENNGSPEEILELVDDAISVLEVAEEAIPAENGDEEEEEQEGVSPVVGAKRGTRKAQEERDEEQEEGATSEEKKEARLRKAQEEEEKEEDEEKKQMEARIASLESELESRQKEALAEEFTQYVPESQREAKYDEIVNGKDSIKMLEAKIKVAKEIYEANQKQASYQPVTKSTSGYLTKRAKLEKTTLPAWRV